MSSVESERRSHARQSTQQTNRSSLVSLCTSESELRTTRPSSPGPRLDARDCRRLLLLCTFAMGLRREVASSATEGEACLAKVGASAALQSFCVGMRGFLSRTATGLPIEESNLGPQRFPRGTLRKSERRRSWPASTEDSLKDIRCNPEEGKCEMKLAFKEYEARIRKMNTSMEVQVTGERGKTTASRAGQ